MGTNVSISVFGSQQNTSTIRKAVEEAFREVRRIDTLMSNYKPDSEVNRINRLKAGEKIKVSDETMQILRRSREISARSAGAFDITVLPLMELWGFYSKSAGESKPNENDIRATLKRIGYKKIMLWSDNSVSKSENKVEIDLGGIAKGYAIDRAAQKLKSYGVDSALIEAGGDFYCLGTKPNKKLWKIAIQHPRKRNKAFAVLEVRDCAIATSGDYENYVIIEGRRYSHIIDPRTGYPRSDTPASVTVVAKDATTADGLATAVFVLGPENGMKLVENMPAVEAIIINDESNGINSAVSSGLKDKIKLIGN